jgi:hypothetical protein
MTTTTPSKLADLDSLDVLMAIYAAQEAGDRGEVYRLTAYAEGQHDTAQREEWAPVSRVGRRALVRLDGGTPNADPAPVAADPAPAACSRCGATGRLTPCEGERLCGTCTTAYLDEKIGDVVAHRFGERYRHARGSDLPVSTQAYRHSTWRGTPGLDSLGAGAQR